MSTVEQMEVLDKYQPYPDYKASGSEWYAKLPSHWKLTRIKFVISKVESGTSVNAVDIPAGVGQKGVLKTSSVYTGIFRPSENKAVLESERERVSCPVKKGCLIVSRMNTPDLVGAAGVVRSDDPDLYLPDRLWQLHLFDAVATFVHYWTLTPEYRNQVRLVCSGTSSSMQNLSQDQFCNFLLPIPPYNDQQAIVAFLDYETARIDRLIALQHRLIELLIEKRQAVISHAVTKGLAPDAPMKDSGVDWLGEVPEHWMVSSLKFIYKNLDYRRIPLSAEERGSRQGDYPYYGASGIIDSIDDYLFSTDHVLVGEDGANLVMRSTPIAFVATGQYWVNNHAHILSMNDGLNSYWAAVIENLDIFPFVSGSAQPKLTAEALGNLIVTYPNKLQERIEIQDFINMGIPKFNTLVDRAQHQVHLLKERRTALISAAVTGKIDLRGRTQLGEVAA